MKRRSFLKVGAAVAASTTVASVLNAADERKAHPDAWTAKNANGDAGVKAAVKALYGTDAMTEGKLTVKTPDTASNGGAVPVEVKGDGDFESIAILQDVNPEALVMVVDQNEASVPHYQIKIKMKQSGSVYAVAKGKDGKLYMGKKTLNVALGGCEG